MKPIKLTIDGINSFKSRQVLDFSALSSGLFCICGDTGAGKSTILDAIILALYGECSRGGGAEYINLDCDKAEIEFEFVMEGERYKVWREYIRTFGEPKKKVKLYKGDTLLSSQLTECVKFIEEIVGLSCSDFTQVVVLEQGKFSKFLHSGRKERSITVSKLFHLDRYRDLHTKAVKAYEEINTQMTIIQRVLTAFDDVSTERLIEDEAQLKQLENQSALNDDELTKASGKIKELTDLRAAYQKSVSAVKRRDILVSEVAAAEDRLSQITLLLGKDSDVYEDAKNDKDRIRVELDRLNNLMPRISEKAECMQRLALARAKYSELNSTATNMRIRLDKLTQERVQYEQKSTELKTGILAFMDYSDPLVIKALAEGIVKDFERLFAELSKLQAELDDCIADEKMHRQILLRYKSDHVNFSDEGNKRTDFLAKAEDEYQGMLTANSAAFVAASLKHGDCCPVCGGTFNGAHLKTADLAQKKQALDALKAEVKNIEGNLAKIDGLIKVEESAIVAAEKRKTEFIAKIEQVKEELEKLKIKNKEDCKTLLSLANQAYSTADALQKTNAEIDKTNANLALTAQALDEQVLRGKELKEQIEKLSAEIERQAGQDPNGRKQQLTEQLSKLTVFIADYEKKQKGITDEINLLQQSLAAKKQEEAMLAADIKEVVFSEDEYILADNVYKTALSKKSGLAEAVGGLKQSIVRAKQVLADKKVKETELNRLKKQADKLGKLKKLFYGEKFLEFVADEYISNFTVDASVILNDISGGKYSLVYEQGEGKFYVIDYLNGAKKRKVSTLSGGETFLASLSLALAIARHIAAKDYDFFFLDEGFGTLDVKRMDMVADALSQLSRCGLVGVISHRSELVERIPTRIRVVACTEDEGSKISVEC